ncbi:MAG TPA: ATP-binding protein [Trebonia sp.]|nr:ATP-binding protein [Trebonia sp.]
MSDENPSPAGPPANSPRSGRDSAPPEPLSLQQPFDRDSLYALRAAVSAHAAAAGLSSQRVYDVVAVAHELAANAVVHGPGHGQLRLWANDGLLYCQVRDSGAASRSAAEKKTVWPSQPGHGLWVVGQVADKVSVDRGDSGTIVTACFATGGRAGRPLHSRSRNTPDRARNANRVPRGPSPASPC